MKYRDIHIETQRQAPNNARTEGFSFLVRAGYLTRENIPTKLGKYTLDHLSKLSTDKSFLFHLSLPTLDNETFVPLPSSSIQVAHCLSCKYVEKLEFARFQKISLAEEEQLPLEKILTPDCHTIEALANLLDIPKKKTAKALMYTRVTDNKFIFVVVRGDMQLSEAKLKQQIGEIRPAIAEEIE